MRSYERSLDDAVEMIGHAKHKEAEVFPVTQVFYFPLSSDVRQAEEYLKLIDLDESFIEALENGVDLVFKGEENEKLVLCTEESTYEVKEGEISNSLVVCPDLQNMATIKSISNDSRRISEVKILGIFNSYLEMRPTFPRLGKIRSLLSQEVYKGEEDEDDSTNSGLYLCEILERVQCSRQELMQELKALKACCIQGRWRMVDVLYESRMLELLVSLMEDKSWTSIPKAEAQRVLQSVMPAFVFNHLATHFCEPDPEDGGNIKLVEKAVSMSFAEMILSAGEGKFRHNEFIMAWKHCMPRGMPTNLDNLRGLALVEKETSEQAVIHLFPEHSLPEDIPERFRLLFKRKSKWTLEEIEPYVRKLTTSKANVNTLLTKYSRPSTLKGARVFGARYTQ